MVIFCTWREEKHLTLNKAGAALNPLGTSFRMTLATGPKPARPSLLPKHITKSLSIPERRVEDGQTMLEGIFAPLGGAVDYKCAGGLRL